MFETCYTFAEFLKPVTHHAILDADRRECRELPSVHGAGIAIGV